jgi:GNAT superfamily N-acetyltransferase
VNHVLDAAVSWLIEPLDKSHDRKAFDCGRPSLDDFLKLHASNYTKRKHARVFVAVRPDDPTVGGYYTLSADSVAFEEWPTTASKKWPKHRVPVILLGRLAVDRLAQGQKLGALLLGDAIFRATQVSVAVGACALRVEAIDGSAAAFYRHHGFEPFADQPLYLFLPLGTVTAG